nr:hypothetical protein [Allisonella histaminiformans]
MYQTTCYVFENAQDGENQLAMKKPAFIYSRLANPTGMYWNALISIPPLSTYEFGWIHQAHWRFPPLVFTPADAAPVYPHRYLFMTCNGQLSGIIK